MHHNHSSGESMMGCSRAKQVYWILGWVQSLRGWAQVESFASSGSARLVPPLDRLPTHHRGFIELTPAAEAAAGKVVEGTFQIGTD